MRDVDTAGMLNDITGFPSQLERAAEAAESITFQPPGPVERVLVTGLGGSAMGGDLVAAWANRAGRAPVVVNRGYGVPDWVNDRTLVIGVSYSGNTEETLSAFEAARGRGAMLAAVASGGRLEALAEKAGATFVRVEGGMQPRAALARSFVPQAVLLARAGVLTADVPRALKEAADATRLVALEVSPNEVPDGNEAKRIAFALRDTVPFIYGADHMAAVARRFANQLNENAKMLASWGELPEMTHNEIVGWSADDDLDRFTAVFLRHPDEHAQVKERFRFTRELVQKRGGRVVQIMARGEGFLASTFATTVLGDAASAYVAIERGLDPTPVDVITGLKDRVAGTGFVKRFEG